MMKCRPTLLGMPQRRALLPAGALFLVVLAELGATAEARRPSVLGVCPPFHLRGEAGEIIDPVHGVNDRLPYSPRQTCGAQGCHDYERITQGYHFTQGRGEPPPADMAARMAWVSTPGNYGGAWCSPAPLYRYLAPKHNGSAQTIDMTSFGFIEAGCANCHPGGGPMEFDRDGLRYDRRMADPASGLKPGGENGLDGDYYRARWSETGVLEADCLMCHLPEYDFAERNRQQALLNLRWAATAGAGLAAVRGAVRNGDVPQIAYDAKRFNPDGTVSLHIVVSPRNQACLNCHAQPGWKKRGANFRSRTDVHLRAGLRCVDCHAAGSRAADARIQGREIHQIGKGDDPGGRVRDDLDDTVRSCRSCHETGLMGARRMLHKGLPPLHLERIACQTCHIPERVVKPILVQASDVISPGARIPSKGKQLWTFYGPDMQYRNHYGYLEMMGYDDKPTERFQPVYARYKGKIYPVNRVHSTWPGVEIEGSTALMQPRMADIRGMWDAHAQDAARYAKLSLIEDDNGDGVIEVNRPEEIDALIDAIDARLREIGYPMEGKRVVWVHNDRIYRSGSEYRTVPKQDWEASPYGNVHKYSHDILAAESALGGGGCTECHSADSRFFHQAVVVYPFSSDGTAVTTEQWRLLGLRRAQVALGGWREERLKPAAPWVLAAVVALALAHLVVFGRRQAPEAEAAPDGPRYRAGERSAHLLVMSSFLVLASTGLLFLLRADGAAAESARSLHKWAGLFFVAGIVLIAVMWFSDARFRPEDRMWLRRLGGYFGGWAVPPAGRFNAGQKLFFWIAVLCGILLALSGIAMWAGLTLGLGAAVIYSAHDVLALALVVCVVGHLYLALVANVGPGWAMFGGARSITAASYAAATVRPAGTYAPGGLGNEEGRAG